jgi:hypothetical protein
MTYEEIITFLKNINNKTKKAHWKEKTRKKKQKRKNERKTWKKNHKGKKISEKIENTTKWVGPMRRGCATSLPCRNGRRIGFRTSAQWQHPSLHPVLDKWLVAFHKFMTKIPYIQIQLVLVFIQLNISSYIAKILWRVYVGVPATFLNDTT